MDYSRLRLADLTPHDTVIARCRCGHIAEFVDLALQRKHGVREETLLVDLPRRLRCSQCGARDDFRISLFDERQRGSLSADERIVLQGKGR
jgi:hypothetical protein